MTIKNTYQILLKTNTKKVRYKTLRCFDTLKEAQTFKEKRKIQSNQELFVCRYINGIMDISFEII